MLLGQTIAAVSTPPGKGGVAIIRVSGDEAFDLLDRVFAPAGGKKLSEYPVRRAVYGRIMGEDHPIDDGLAIRFAGPASFTGEDMGEIYCHGGILVTRKVLEEVLARGAVQAGPGEFTRRAFVNGKLSLSRAEAIGQLLEAQSDAQLRLAAPDATGALEGEAGGIYRDLLSLMTSLYADIDYPDEDLGELSDAEITARLSAVRERLSALLATYGMGHAVAEGIPTVICGRPNVGKSSLYNLLSGEEAAIVTDVAGTTRDVLERTVTLGPVTLHLCDTAGIRETSDTVERIGVERTRARMDRAELILAVFDRSAPLTDEDRALLRDLEDRTHATRVAILNKADLPAVLSENELRPCVDEVLTLSCTEGDATPLGALIETLFLRGRITPGDTAILTSARQAASVRRALECVEAALAAFGAGVAHDVASSDVQQAMGALGELSGREVSEEIVAGIFAHFCVGK